MFTSTTTSAAAQIESLLDGEHELDNERDTVRVRLVQQQDELVVETRQKERLGHLTSAHAKHIPDLIAAKINP